MIVIGQQGFQRCSGDAAMAGGGGAHECDRIGGQSRDNVGWQIGSRAAIVRRGFSVAASLMNASGGKFGWSTISGRTCHTSPCSVHLSYDPSGGLVGIGRSGASVLAFVDQHTDVVGDFIASGTALSGSTTYDPLGNVTATSTQAGRLGYQSGWTDSSTGKVNMAVGGARRRPASS